MNQPLLTPDFAWVWWDYDSDGASGWVIECWACNQPPWAPTPGLPDSQIRAALLIAAERHNQERHTESLKEV